VVSDTPSVRCVWETLSNHEDYYTLDWPEVKSKTNVLINS